MIEVRDVTKQYGDFKAVRDLNLDIASSSGITALLGPNGAGKTTTMRLLTGYLTPTRGEIRVDGLSLSDPGSRVEVKRKVGYLPETSPLYPEMLVSEFLQFVGHVRGVRGDELERRGRIMVESLELGSHLYSPIGILSRGFRQRVALAGSLIHDPPIVILDEPTSGLDPNQISHIRSIIRELGREKIVLLSTHVLQEVEDLCERVVIISRGRVVADESTESLRHSHSLSLTVRGGGVREHLEGLPMVLSCREEGEVSEGFRRYHCELKHDRTEELFADIARSGWEVREFMPLTRSLEEIFRERTA